MEAIDKVITDILARLGKLEEAVFSTTAAVSIRGKKISPKEFLMAKSATSDPKKVLTLAYFLEYVEGMQSFNVNDLETAFRAAKEQVPSNINETVNKNIAKGFLMEAADKKDSKKAWAVTNLGEQFVNNDFKKVKT